MTGDESACSPGTSPGWSRRWPLRASRRPHAEAILERASRLLDFGRPVALSLIDLMHFLPDEQDPYGITRTPVGALPPGSHLILSHGAADQRPELRRETESAYRKGAIALRMRTREEAEPFFEGLELVEPGLVTAPEWYEEEPAPAYERSGFYTGVAWVVQGGRYSGLAMQMLLSYVR